MQIQREESGSKGAFYIEENGKRLGEMTYTKAGDTRIIINHTEVSNELRGKSAGKQLVAAAVDHARKNNLKILPLCPFAKSVFDKVTEYGDVLDK
ncbi:MAG TPA: GNAT family N-acetyltransferase [Ohtaekwangia sp.]|uniref:GNAT family N-acetyltransferase n=1 Tax=Ohtaekwangia sp. TaxID=2066019 RepID=UPI002F950004